MTFPTRFYFIDRERERERVDQILTHGHKENKNTRYVINSRHVPLLDVYRLNRILNNAPSFSSTNIIPKGYLTGICDITPILFEVQCKFGFVCKYMSFTKMSRIDISLIAINQLRVLVGINIVICATGEENATYVRVNNLKSLRV